MGCDIHMVLEQKYEGEWVGIHAYPHLDTAAFSAIPERIRGRSWAVVTSRNYELFGKLAGVRTPGPAPLGIPEDVSQLSRALIKWWDGDGHSHSYLSLAEFTKRYAACGHVIAKSVADRLQGKKLRDLQIICAGGYNPADYTEVIDMDNDIRIVFWFDN